jgi:hypothetical protein
MLLEHGISYPNVPATLGDVQITSGNGQQVAQFLQPAHRSKRFKESTFLATFKSIYLEGGDVTLISSEGMGARGPDPDKFAQLVALVSADAELTVIALARDPYGNAYSSWMSYVKRRGVTESFAEMGPGLGDTRIRALRRWHQLWPDLKVVHYNSVRDRLHEAFFEAAGCDVDLARLESLPIVNRSLTYDEVSLLLELNRMHGGALASQLSDTLIYAAPDTKTELPLVASVVDAIRASCQSQVDWMNKTFFGGPVMRTIDREAVSSEAQEAPPLTDSQRLLFEFLVRNVLGDVAYDPRMAKLPERRTAEREAIDAVVQAGTRRLARGDAKGALLLGKAAMALDVESQPARSLVRRARMEPPNLSTVSLAHARVRSAAPMSQDAISFETQIQEANTTHLNRYPGIFERVATLVGARAPGSAPASILSFGCSTGEEVVSLDTLYLDGCDLMGVDVSDDAIAEAQTKSTSSRNNRISFHHSRESAYRRPHDVVLALSVLCSWPTTQTLTDIATIYDYQTFAKQIHLIDALVAPGGYLVIHNANYFFEDTYHFAASYRPVCLDFDEIGFVTRFDRASAVYTNARSGYVFFQKVR